ncbi:dTDP-4-amino-4,6-dideoxygalactose transaminase [Vibrio sp. DNB22_10_4]
MIPFNVPPVTGDESKYIGDVLQSKKLSGDGRLSRQCENWFEREFKAKKTLLMPSCTAALELAAILIGIQPGDEVIVPSYTFVSTANAFVLRGAQIVFVDIRSDTMNIDEDKIEAAITAKTKVIVPVHYAGVACEMDKIMEIAERYSLFVIEDAAQGVMSTYKGKALGTIGHLGAYSFHETKNYTSGGEGGLLLINDENFIERAEVIREKGTNRSQFFRGMVDKYSWVDIGSSYLPSELQSAYLWAQLENAEKINDSRLLAWGKYKQAFSALAEKGVVDLPIVPEACVHNAHMFYLKVANLDERTRLLDFMKENGVLAVFHYVPLHSSIAGKRFGCMNGSDDFTTQESERLIRLPLWFGIEDNEINQVTKAVLDFYS